MARGGDGSTLPRVRAVSRAIAVLRAFTAEQPMLALSEVARIAGLDAGTTRRILVTLADEGLVRQPSGTSHYQLTQAVAELAASVSVGQSLREIVHDDLIRLARSTQTTAFLSVLQNDQAVCVARHHGTAAIEVKWWSVGGNMPLHCGAAPRVLLAHMPEHKLAKILGDELVALTPKGITDPQVLRRELARVRKQGWAMAVDDVAEGLSAVAAPICNRSGEVIAAVSMAGLSPHIGSRAKPRQLSALMTCVDLIAEKLIDFSVLPTD